MANELSRTSFVLRADKAAAPNPEARVLGKAAYIFMDSLLSDLVTCREGLVIGSVKHSGSGGIVSWLKKQQSMNNHLTAAGEQAHVVPGIKVSRAYADLATLFYRPYMANATDAQWGKLGDVAGEVVGDTLEVLRLADVTRPIVTPKLRTGMTDVLKGALSTVMRRREIPPADQLMEDAAVIGSVTVGYLSERFDVPPPTFELEKHNI